DRVRGVQVEPRAARLEADQDDVRLAPFEGVHHLLPIGCRARLRDLPDVSHTHAIADHPTYAIVAGSLTLALYLLSSRRTQLHYLVDDHNRGAGDALLDDGEANLAVGRNADALVEIPLVSFELHGAHELRLRRQVPGHALLEAPQDEGGDAVAQGDQRLLVAAALDRIAVALAELLGATQEPGHGELEQRPELGEVVLDGRPGQREPVTGLERAHRDARLAARVLDRLGLVEDDVMVRPLREPLEIPQQDGVAGDHDLGPVELPPELVAARPREGQHADVRG